ncbi:MAG: polysaccharide deacetylase [Rhodobacteraceae bacterium]|nr:polysaccharide deacetylase [Paracoccaceae bacterium]
MAKTRQLIPDPPPWPNGARCAVAFTFDMDADSILHLAHHENATNLVASMSMLQYGPRVAMPRILALFREFEIRQTFFIPSWCIERYPEVAEAVLADGHELGYHGYVHEHPNELSRDREAYWLRRGIEVLERVAGKRPVGYRAPSYRFSRNSLDLLLDEGIRYDASLFGDEIPYLLSNGESSLVELPSHYAMDDWAHYMVGRDFNYMMPIKAPSHAMDIFRSEFDAAWRHGALWISVWHPFLSGRLARFEAIAELLEYMTEKGDVWFAPLSEIAAHVESLISSGAWSPRTDLLPQYPGPIPELDEGL